MYCIGIFDAYSTIAEIPVTPPATIWYGSRNAVNEKALIPTDDGTQIAVGAVKPLATTPVMISSDFGSQWSESVIKTDLYIYGVDTVGKKIWRTNGQTLECISDFKV